MYAVSSLTSEAHPRPQIAIDLGLTIYAYRIEGEMAIVSVPSEREYEASALGYTLYEGVV